MLFSRRFSRTCLEGISFKFFVCFIFNVSLGSAPKRKSFDIQRNTRVGSEGQFTSNRLSCHHISSCCAFSRYQHVRHKFMCLLEQGPKQSIFCNISGFENFKPQGFVSKVFASEKFQIYERHTCGQA